MNKTKLHSKNVINIVSYFLILLPLFLVSGPLLSDLAVSIMGILSLFFLRDKKFFNNYFFIFFMIFWTLIILSSFFSGDKTLSFKSSIFYFRFCLFSLFVWWILENNIKILKKNIFFFITLFFCNYI
jgi:hypothetical protein